MIVHYRITDDLGWKYHAAGTVEAPGVWQGLEQVISQLAIQERFRDKPFASLMIEVSPAVGELSFDSRKEAAQQS